MDRLSSAVLGAYVRIKKIDGEEFALKFLELGICPGKIIEVVRVAPAGDPMAIKVGRSIFAIRLEEAEHIWIENKE
jgi:ferrous iron transport protein A